MRALVISGGGSKGAFAGGVSQYLLQEANYNYDIFVGTSTGSLLVSHLALNKIEEIKKIYTSVDQASIFSSNPFLIKQDKSGNKQVSINHWRVLLSFLKRRKTFGESNNLRKLIANNLSIADFQTLHQSNQEVLVTVSNLTTNCVEFKALKHSSYNDFCDWIWASANFIPFMTLVQKNGCEYADGGFGNMVPIVEAINRGAKIVDVIVLETKFEDHHAERSKNAFALLTETAHFMAKRIEQQNIRIGKLLARNKGVLLNFYYTPTVLTTNPLIFDKQMMTRWWEEGYAYAKARGNFQNEVRHHKESN